MHKVYLLLGTNLDDRVKNLSQAKEKIAAIAEIIRESAIYSTAPWGKLDQQDFLNQALLICTSLSPNDLLLALQAIELEMGRVRLVKWEARIIDIDIMYYDDLIINSQVLQVPHPLLHNRRFALIPLAEIEEQGFKHPYFNKSNKFLIDACEDDSEVKHFTHQ